MSQSPAYDDARSDPEALEFMRRRIAAYGGILGLVGLAGLVIRTVMAFAFGYEATLERDPSLIPHAAATAAFLLLYASARFGPGTWHFLVAAESLGMILGSCGYIWMGASIPIQANPVPIVSGVMSLGFFARAIYVPSPPRRTLILGVVLGVCFAAAMYVHAVEDLTPELLATIEAADLGPGTPNEFALNMAIEAVVWWTFSVILATLASRVIYGLRSEVRDVKRLGQYTLETKIGEGGMGVVYRASHGMLRRPTAVKLLHPETTGQAALARFEREVQLTAKLTHTNTVTIFDYGRTPEGVFYYAMELLDGATLHDVVEASSAQDPSRVVHIIRQAAAALAEAHDIGLIHRDIKPANIMLCTQGGELDVAKVCDFGLVKELDRASVSMSQDVVAGTPQYIAPEAITDPQRVDARTDVYALGAVAFYLLTGEHVFAGTSVVEVCSHHLHTKPDRPSERLGSPLPSELEELVLECLAKDPGSRPKTAHALAKRLAQLEIPAWTQERALSWWGDYGEELQSRLKEPDSGAGTLMMAIDR